MLHATHQYWPKNKPVPQGWRVVDELKGTHHGRYCVLLLWEGI